MNAETTRERLQRIADAALAGNRLMATLQLQPAMETAAEHPGVWVWQAWTAGSPSEAIASLHHARSIGAAHPMIESGLEWFESLERLAAGQIQLEAVAESAPPEQPPQAEQAPQVEKAPAAAAEFSLPTAALNPVAAGELEPEAALLSTLAAIHDEVFAALNANPPHNLDDLQTLLRPRGGPVVRRSRT